ncbi:MAG: hypothetical protein ONB12_04345 [candidate division KSB1 bacterium]|nr:hypothetical protein [candidate division KSB1 bacterium]
MKERAALFLLILIGLCPALTFGGEAVLTLTARKWYAVTAETQKETAALDRLYDAFIADAAATTGLRFVPVDSIQRSIGRPFLFDWQQYGDAIPLQVHRRFGLQAVIYITLEKNKTGYSGRLTAYEFPSYTLINEFNHISLSPQEFGRERRRMQQFIRDLMALRTPYGFPVSLRQRAAALLIRPNSSDFSSAPITVRRYSQLVTPRNVPPLAVPVIERPIDMNLEILADSLFTLLGVDALVSLSEPNGLGRIVLPCTPLRARALSNRLPLWPALRQFTVFPVPADTAVVRLLGAVLLHPQEEGEIPAALQQPLLLKRIQLLEADSIADPAHHARLIELYRRLGLFYNAESEEYDWLGANLAVHFLGVVKEREAAELFQQSCASFRRRKNHLGAFLTALEAAALEQRFSEFGAAEEHLLSALDAAQQLGDIEAAAFVQYRLGELLFAVDRKLEAWERFDESIEGYTAIGDKLMTARIYIQLGILMRQSNSLLKSRDYLLKGLKAAEEAGAEREAAYAHFHLGVALKNLLTDEAEAHFETAADALELLGEVQNLANCEEHLGDIAAGGKQWTRAQRSYEAAVRFYRSSNRPEDALRSLVKAGDAAVERRLYPKAQRLYDEALQLADELQSGTWGSIVLYKKGLAHIDAGELEEGERELELAKRTTDVDLSQIDGFMENLLRRLEEELNSMREVQR